MTLPMIDRLNIQLLVVDDDYLSRSVLTRYLSHAGFSVTTAADGREAIRACMLSRYDLVILDIQMPDMDGIEVANRVSPARVLFFSQSSLENGHVPPGNHVGHFHKSVNPGVIIDFIGRLFDSRHHSTALNVGTISSIISCDTSGELFASIVERFASMLTLAVTELESAITRGDYSQCSAILHRLAGSSHAIGAPNLAALCVELRLSPSIDGLSRLNAVSKTTLYALRAHARKGTAIA